MFCASPQPSGLVNGDLRNFTAEKVVNDRGNFTDPAKDKRVRPGVLVTFGVETSKTRVLFQ